MEEARVAERTCMVKLANQPHTEVFEYTYDTPHREANAVTCVKLATLAIEARRELPATVSIAVAARRICKQNDILKQFSPTHPQIFMVMMDCEKTQKHSKCSSALPGFVKA